MIPSYTAVPTQEEAQKALTWFADLKKPWKFNKAKWNPDSGYEDYIPDKIHDDKMKEYIETIRAALAHFAADSQKGDDVDIEELRREMFIRCFGSAFPNTIPDEHDFAASVYNQAFNFLVSKDFFNRANSPQLENSRPDGLTLELARALVAVNDELDSRSWSENFAIYQPEKHAATIKIAEDMVKEKRDAG